MSCSMLCQNVTIFGGQFVILKQASADFLKVNSFVQSQCSDLKVCAETCPKNHIETFETRKTLSKFFLFCIHYSKSFADFQKKIVMVWLHYYSFYKLWFGTVIWYCDLKLVLESRCSSTGWVNSPFVVYGDSLKQIIVFTQLTKFSSVKLHEFCFGS